MFDTTGAACEGQELEVFFHEGHSDKTKIKAAKAICSSCPLVYQCLTWAVNNENFGIWGGKTPYEVKQIRHSIARNPKNKTLIIMEAVQPKNK